MGDAAVIRTPHKSWIYYERMISPLWKESSQVNDFNQVTVTDFYKFIRDMTSHFSNGTFAIQFSSDGFKRTSLALQDALKSGQHNLKSTKQQLNTLFKHRKAYAQEFKLLKNIKNSVSSIGETPRKTYNLIHSILTADLIITAAPVQHTIALSLISLYCSPTNQPATIILYKKCSEEKFQNLFSRFKSRRKAILVDISAPNYTEISRRLNELFPNI